MAFNVIAMLLLALAADSCASASAGVVGLPIVDVLPSDCGSVLTVQEGDTCESLADFGGIDVVKYSSLNLLAMCGSLPPAPGSVVCVGDKLAGCSNIHITAAGDTCDSIEASLGVIVGGTLKCSALQPDISVCVRPGVNQCDVDSLCGVPLSDGVRELLGIVPDWCTVLGDCQAQLAATTTDGRPSLTATFTNATPTASQVASNAGHPELREFVKQRAAGRAQLQVAFVPDATGSTHPTNFVITTGATGRKLLASYHSTGQMQYPRKRYYPVDGSAGLRLCRTMQAVSTPLCHLA